MFKFKRKKDGNDIKDTPSGENEQSRQGWFARLKQGLSKTRANLGQSLANLVLGHKTLDDSLLEEIETQLLMADVGVDATNRVIQTLTDKLSRKELKDSEAVLTTLRESLESMLQKNHGSLVLDTEKKPYVILVVGVNGAGKTTTIGKLANHFKQGGLEVMLAAGDTFRAAAVEQLQTWGERNDIPVVAQHTGADSASVIYDAIESARSKNMDLLIADTAGRLHTQSNLMEELKKVKRVMAKLDSDAPHEVLLVMDAGTGQNALSQTQQFNDAVGVTGLVLTKLDGTAKGGIVFAISEKLDIPIRYIGVGESLHDLREFNPAEFVSALFE